MCISRKGRSLQWERGLKYNLKALNRRRLCRSLQWERGLKFSPVSSSLISSGSFPAMGTWIEIFPSSHFWVLFQRRSLQWERGLKYASVRAMRYFHCRSLQWERGLKYNFSGSIIAYKASFPAMGTWIEIP